MAAKADANDGAGNPDRWMNKPVLQVIVACRVADYSLVLPCTIHHN